MKILLKKLALIVCAQLSWVHIHAQNTPQELGTYLLGHLKNGALSKIDSLVPSLEEMKILAKKIGLKEESKQYLEAIAFYKNELESLHEKINNIYADTTDNSLTWKSSALEKVSVIFDSAKVDEKDQNSQSILLTRIAVYFSSNSKKFRLTVDDAFEINGLWKIGNSIYLKPLE